MTFDFLSKYFQQNIFNVFQEKYIWTLIGKIVKIYRGAQTHTVLLYEFI